MHLEDHLRELAPLVLTSLVRRGYDFAAAEDAVQEALVAAALRWPGEGLPENPRAWLAQVAFRKLADGIRRDVARRQREERVAAEAPQVVAAAVHAPESSSDDTLDLLFMCCHPALSPASAIALTLRAVGGLTTTEIAHAFLVPEATLGQRISRAKQAIRDSGIPLARPEAAQWVQRLGAVLHVLYLIFNEGYAASSGEEHHRTDLCQEALRLARLLQRLAPHDPEAAGLLALLLLTEARRPARQTAAGQLVSLEDQDRRLWDRAQIAEGVALLSKALPRGAVGPYQLQAAIAALHDEAPSAEATDWAQILGLYELLERMTGNPIVTMNRAVALAMVHGPAAGLQLLRGLEKDERVASGHRLTAIQAHLHERSGDLVSARAAYRLAATRASSLPERNYLLLRAARLGECA